MKIYIVRFLYTAVVAFFILSCAKLPIYLSQKPAVNEEETFSNSVSAHYDKKSNTSFQLANNDTFLFVHAVFHGQESLMKIMRGGLILSFDPEGRKDSNYKLKIERSEKSQIQNYGQMQPTQSQGFGIAQNLPTMIGMNFNKVTWDKNGKEFVFYWNILKDPIYVDFGPNKQNELTLNVKLPLNEIPFSRDQKIFSMGFETGKIAAREKGQSSGGNMQSGGRGMGNGGGRRGGGMGGGMNGRAGGGMNQNGAYQSGATPLVFWVQVQLN